MARATKKATGREIDQARLDALEARQAETDEKIDALTESVSGVGSKLDQILSAMQAPGAISRARVDVRELGGTDSEDGAVTAETDPFGDTILVRPTPNVDPDHPRAKEHLEYEQFLNEPVTIVVLEGSEPSDDPIVELGVNGKRVVIMRGQKTTVPRKYVEQLMRMRTTSYRNEEFVRNDGVRDVRWPSRTGLRYPFQVISDPNPRGAEWLQKIARAA